MSSRSADGLLAQRRHPNREIVGDSQQQMTHEVRDPGVHSSIGGRPVAPGKRDQLLVRRTGSVEDLQLSDSREHPVRQAEVRHIR